MFTLYRDKLFTKSHSPAPVNARLGRHRLSLPEIKASTALLITIAFAAWMFLSATGREIDPLLGGLMIVVVFWVSIALVPKDKRIRVPTIHPLTAFKIAMAAVPVALVLGYWDLFLSYYPSHLGHTARLL